MAWNTPPPKTWTVGDVLDATPLNTEIRDRILELQAAIGFGTAWTCAWTGATNPTNYTGNSLYIRIGDMVTAWFNITAIAGFTAGTGAYNLSLPLPIVAGHPPIIGSGRIGSGSTSNFVTFETTSVTTVRPIYQSSLTATAAETATAPFTMASGGFIRGSVTYQAA